jgi:hypothetical protein
MNHVGSRVQGFKGSKVWFHGYKVPNVPTVGTLEHLEVLVPNLLEPLEPWNRGTLEA